MAEPKKQDFGPAASKTAQENPSASPFQNTRGDQLPERSKGFADWKVPGEEPGVISEDELMKVAETEAPPEGDPVTDGTEGLTAVNPEGDRSPLGTPEKPADPDKPAAEPSKEAPPQDPKAEPDPKTDESAQGEGLTGVLDKYGATDQKLARSYLEIQKLSTAQGQENAALRDEITSVQADRDLIDQHFETADDGTRKLRPERAAQRLQEVVPPAAMVSNGELVKQARADMEAVLKEAKMGPDEIEIALDNARERIAANAKAKGEELNRRVESQRMAESGRAGMIADKHFSKNPDHEKAIPLLDKFLAGFPEDVRHRMINSGWVDFDDLVRMCYRDAIFEPALRETYDLGIKNGGTQLTPQDGGAPAAGVTTPVSPGIRQDPDAELKTGILNARVLSSIFSD